MKYLSALLLFALFFSCQDETKLSNPFHTLDVSHTGIDFSNTLIETEEDNILEYLYFYNGAGIAVEDFNNDGLEDLYLGSNQTEDQIYFNKGDFKFENVSHLFESKHLKGWTTGVNVIDVNEDGWMDIYVCRLGNYKAHKDSNKLFINQGGEKFVEAAADHGLDFSGFGTQAAFLDYDRDGDLDCYLLNHSVKDPDQFKKSNIRMTKDSLAGDLFLENIDQKFVDVTDASNIYSSAIGFGLGISVADINNDNWPDIYVCNDFHEQDYLYINNGDKTFSEHIQKSTTHISNFSMGTSIADLNNDLKFDIITLDMKPFDDETYKKSGGWESSQIYNYKRSFGYHHQSPRNAFQINQGTTNGIPHFSEQACLFGTEATDWSWSPLVADFDNDGDQDVYISNGIKKRPNDMDFINFTFDASAKNKIPLLAAIPSGAVENIYFENQGTNKPYKKYLNDIKTVSNTAVVSDLNLDGIPDLVVGHLNKHVSIIKNNADPHSHFVQVKLIGGKGNPRGVGSKVILYASNTKQLRHVQSTDGFLSHSSSLLHFGLGNNTQVDSLMVYWPTGFIQKIANPKVDTINEITQVIPHTNKLSTVSSKNSNCNVENLAFKWSDKNRHWQTENKWALYNPQSNDPELTEKNGKIVLSSVEGKILATIENENQIETQSTDHILPAQLRSMLQDELILRMAHSDFDQDGDEDHFIQTNEMVGIFVNNNSKYYFIDIPIDEEIKVAFWANLDGSENEELILAGHWMPITIISIDKNEIIVSTIENSNGLWSSLYVDDLDGDGRKDIIAGNFGLNHSLNATSKQPIKNYTNDFDRNGSVETLVTYFANGKEVPYPNQDLFVSQLPAAKKKFLKSSDYVAANIPELLPEKTFAEAKIKYVNQLASCYFIQKDSSWEQHQLPFDLQVTPIFAIEKLKNNSFCFGGNLFDVDPNLGRQDSGNLSIYDYKNNSWHKSNVYNSFCPIYKEVRDILYFEDKLYLCIKGDSLKVVYLNQ